MTFDGLLAIPAWKRFQGQLPQGFTVGSAGYIFVAMIAFAVLVGLAWTVFGLFAKGVRDVGRLDLSVRLATFKEHKRGLFELDGDLGNTLR